MKRRKPKNAEQAERAHDKRFQNTTTRAIRSLFVQCAIIAPVGTVSRSKIDTCGRVASSNSVVVSRILARSISFEAGALNAEDEWFMEIDN